jgi:hypothetical protein
VSSIHRGTVSLAEASRVMDAQMAGSAGAAIDVLRLRVARVDVLASIWERVRVEEAKDPWERAPTAHRGVNG